MKIIAMLFRFGALGVAALFLIVARSELSAQSATDVPHVTSVTSPEELSQTELLKSYLELRKELYATQLAIANSRAEAETAARLRAAAITDKLESIKSSMEGERERHRVDTERANAERERFRTDMERLNAEREWQQAELERSNRSVLWIAGIGGGLGLLAIFLTPLFQWWTIQRLSATAWHPPARSIGLLSDGNGEVAATDQAVAVTNQRLMSAIERMERRIFDFEHRWCNPGSTTLTNDRSGSDGSHYAAFPAAAQTVGTADPASHISGLLAKGQSLVEAGKITEALTSYNEVLKLDLNHPEALVKRGAALERLKQDEEAIQCYDRAIKADRKMTLAYLHKGAVCNRLERYEEALKCYQQALLAEEEEIAVR